MNSELTQGDLRWRACFLYRRILDDFLFGRRRAQGGPVQAAIGIQVNPHLRLLDLDLIECGAAGEDIEFIHLDVDRLRLEQRRCILVGQCDVGQFDRSR